MSFGYLIVALSSYQLGSRPDIDLMVCSGRAAIESRLVWHKSVQNALQALDDAHNIDPPSTEEQLLQLSVGGISIRW